MSRALDAKTKDALKNGNHDKVFDDISGALSQSLDDLLEIEFLPSSHTLGPDTSFLQDGCAIAIPKLSLVRAFLVAHGLLSRYTKSGLTESGSEVMKFTAVVLLMDPEHLTAANARKQVIRDAMAKDVVPQKVLQREKYLIDSLLTSRLHRHTKSPILWNHRRWLMEQYKKLGLAVDHVDDLKRVILISAERHPRNYYAWCEARFLVRRINMESEGQAELLSTILEETKKWCFAHHNDISGWAFLMFLIQGSPKAAPILEETLELTRSFHWRNESVWYFLRNMGTRDFVTASHRDELESVRKTLSQGTEEGSMEKRVLKQAHHWLNPQSVGCDENQQTG